MDKNQKDSLSALVSATWNTLRTHKEWEERYAGFSIDVAKGNIVKRVEEKLKKIASKPKLSLYTSVSREPSEVSLRFAGQIVACIKEQNGITVTSQDNFTGAPALSNELLDSSEVDKFLSFFEEKADVNKVEDKKGQVIDALLKELKRSDKILPFVQPILLNSMFFSMPVPFDEKGNYLQKRRQGYIDIVARVENDDKNCRLCVIQVNANNNVTPIKSVESALIYATFIVALLRSNCAKKWRVFFGLNNGVPENHLEVDIVTAIPSGMSEQSKDFPGDISFENDLDCAFHCHTLYYEKKELLAGRLKNFGGTYPICLSK